jgi:hypothetical protein
MLGRVETMSHVWTSSAFRITLLRWGLNVALLVASLSIASPVHAGGVVGDGTPASCTEAALTTALTGGGTVTFNCGGPTTILVLSEKNITRTPSLTAEHDHTHRRVDAPVPRRRHGLAGLESYHARQRL